MHRVSTVGKLCALQIVADSLSPLRLPATALAATYVTHPWRLKHGEIVVFEYCGDSTTITVAPDGTSAVHPGEAPPPAASLLPPPEGLPHPTDPSQGTFKIRNHAKGIPMCAYDCVSEAAVAAAAHTLDCMLSDVQPAVLDRLITLGAAVGIIARHHGTTDTPQHAHLKGQRSSDGRDFDKETRGLGGSLACPMTTVGEENLLMDGTDTRYPHESILVHEWAHCVMGLGLHGRPELRAIKAAYAAAIKEGLHDPESYLASNADEYWAEATQAWFEATVRTDATAGMTTRAAVKTRDPRLAAVLEAVWGDGEWRFLDTAPGRFTPFKKKANRRWIAGCLTGCLS
jgi:hypothetical protein